MKVRFVTTLKQETIVKLKIMAAKVNKPVNAIIDELVEMSEKKKEV